MALTQSKLNPHHIFVPSKPHPNRCFFNSVADSNGLMLNLSLRRRMKVDLDALLFNTKQNYHWSRNQFPAVPTDSTTNQVQKLLNYSSGSIICVDSYYGSYQTVEALAIKGVYCVCKCVSSNSYIFILFLSLLFILVRPSWIFRDYLHPLLKLQGSHLKVFIFM